MPEAVELEMPSGVTILARRPDPLQIAMWGELPLGLVPVDGEAEKPDVTREQVLGWIRLARDIVEYCCLKPRVTMKPAGPDEIHPSAIGDEDLKFILRWARREEAQDGLRTFRGEQKCDRAGSGGRDVGAAAERDAGDRRAGDSAGAGSGDRGGAAAGA
jgi:hypothetical protein